MASAFGEIHDNEILYRRFFFFLTECFYGFKYVFKERLTKKKKKKTCHVLIRNNQATVEDINAITKDV